MKTPRDLSGEEVIRALRRQGFNVARQRGSHVRLEKGSLRVTVPAHGSINVRTLSSILEQANLDRDEFLDSL